MWRCSRVLALAVCAIGSPSWTGPHPFHDDNGAVNWRPNLAAALKAAQTTGKPIFLEAGREA
jgi:hypothetical protein